MPCCVRRWAGTMPRKTAQVAIYLRINLKNVHKKALKRDTIILFEFISILQKGPFVQDCTVTKTSVTDLIFFRTSIPDPRAVNKHI